MKRVEFGQKENPQVLFLHGFPGIRSRQNRDYAEAAATELQRHAIVPCYDGLGQEPGVFSFQTCLQNVEKLFLELTADNSIDLVGHSWGGFMSLWLARHYGARIDKVVLISPLFRFHPVDLCRQSFAQTQSENPQIDLGDLDALAHEFVALGEANPVNLVSAIPENVQISILQAKDDEITPPDVAMSSLALFARRPTFELMDTDHSFLLNRDRNCRRILAHL